MEGKRIKSLSVTRINRNKEKVFQEVSAAVTKNTLPSEIHSEIFSKVWSAPRTRILRTQSRDHTEFNDISKEDFVEKMMEAANKYYRHDLLEIYRYLQFMVHFYQPAVSAITLEINILAGICRNVVNYPTYTMFNMRNETLQYTECFEKAVTNIIAFYSQGFKETSELVPRQQRKNIKLIIFWAIGLIRLCLIKLSYYLAWINGFSNKSSDNSKVKDIPLKELAEKLKFINATIKPENNRNKEECSSLLVPYDEVLEAYLNIGKFISMEKKETLYKPLKINPMIRIFITNIISGKLKTSINPCADFLSRRIKRWKEMEQIGVKLLCRICEQIVPYNDYMVHTSLCLQKVEVKKQFQNVDETLLNFGEELTENIKVLSKTASKRKSKVNNFLSPNWNSNRRDMGKTVLERTSNCMPLLIKKRGPSLIEQTASAFSTTLPKLSAAKGPQNSKNANTISSIKKSLFAFTLEPNESNSSTTEEKIDPPVTRKISNLLVSHENKKKIESVSSNQDSLKISSKQKVLTRMVSHALIIADDTINSSKKTDIASRDLIPKKPEEKKARPLKPMQTLNKFAPAAKIACPKIENEKEKETDGKSKIVGTGKTPSLKQRNRIKNMRDALLGNNENNLSILPKQKSARNLLTDRFTRYFKLKSNKNEEKKDEEKEKENAKSESPLNKVMKRFLKLSAKDLTIHKVNKTLSAISSIKKASNSKLKSIPKGRPGKPKSEKIVRIPTDMIDAKDKDSSAEPPKTLALNKRKDSRKTETTIPETKEEEEEESKHTRRPNLERTVSGLGLGSGSGSGGSCSLEKHRLVRSLKKKEKTHGAQLTMEKMRKNEAEAATLVSNRKEIEVMNQLRGISRNVYLIDIAFNSTYIFQMLKFIESLEELSKQFKGMKQIYNAIMKLIVQLKDKIRIVKEFADLSYKLDNISLNKPIGVHPFTMLEMDFAKRREDIILVGLKTPNGVRSRNNNSLYRKSMIESMIYRMTPSPCRRPLPEPITRTSELDLRKLAIANSIKGAKQLEETRPSTVSGSRDSGSGSYEFDKSENSELSESSIIAESIAEISGDLSNVRLKDHENIRQNHLSKSVFIPIEKPFDKTQGEQQIEAIYKNLTKPTTERRASFEDLSLDCQFEEDQRLNNSCVLDYSLETCYFKKSKNRRLNSYVFRETTLAELSDPSKPKKLSIEDFELIQGLSSGAYGKVFLAKKKSTGDYFAIKMIDREKTIAKAEEEYIMSEINILRNLDSDYIVKLYYSFQSEDYLYFVMDYMNGGDFGNLLQNIGIIDEKYSRLYLAEIVLALEYLHSKNIYHRDMKPENILIDSKGHLKLTDFGLSQSRIEVQHRKWIQNYFKEKDKPQTEGEEQTKETTKLVAKGSPNKKKRFVGTPHYLAPEVITEQKGSFAADWWAVGVIMFEMMVGGPPFNGSTPDEVFGNIIKNKRDVEIKVGDGEDHISPEAEKLINGLLCMDPEKRLGKNGAQEVKNCSFFKDINWSKLRDEEPPFVPAPLNISDTSYFADHKRFKATDIEFNKKKSPNTIERRSILGFDFNTTNAGSLAQKNKDAFLRQSIKSPKISKFASADYEVNNNF